MNILVFWYCRPIIYPIICTSVLQHSVFFIDGKKTLKLNEDKFLLFKFDLYVHLKKFYLNMNEIISLLCDL